jgi:hypothetical protein
MSTIEDRMFDWCMRHGDALPHGWRLDGIGEDPCVCVGDGVWMPGLEMWEPVRFAVEAAMLRYITAKHTIGLVGPSQVDREWIIGFGGESIVCADDLATALLDAADVLDGRRVECRETPTEK